MSHWEEPIFPQEKVASGDGDAGNNSLESFDSADHQDIILPIHYDCFHDASNPRSVIGEGITSPHRDLSDPTSSARQGPSSPGSLPECEFTLRVEYGEHGWHANPEQDVGHGSHGQGLPPLVPLFASHPSGQGGHRGTLQITPSTCKWRAADGSTCRGIITRPSVPQHLAKHGIVDLRSDTPIECLWCPDGSKRIKRKGIVRHVREVHLHLKRQHTSTASANGLNSVLDVAEQSNDAGLNTEDHAQGYRHARPPRKRKANPQTTRTSRRRAFVMEPDPERASVASNEGKGRAVEVEAGTQPLGRTHNSGAIVGSSDSEGVFPDTVTAMVYTDKNSFEVSHGTGKYATSPNAMIAFPKITSSLELLSAKLPFLLPKHCQPLDPLTEFQQQPRDSPEDHLYENTMPPPVPVTSVTTGLSSMPVANTAPASPVNPPSQQERQDRSDQTRQQIGGGYPPDGGYRPMIPPRYATGDIEGVVSCHDGPGAYHQDVQCRDPCEMYEASHGWGTSLRLARHLELMDSMPVFSPPIDELSPYCELPNHQHLGGPGPSPGPPSEPHPCPSYPHSSQEPAI